MNQYIWVFIGGGLGSVSRYAISVYLNKNITTGFPWSTLMVNVLGSLLIGFLLGFALKNNSQHSLLILFLTAGFCGGFTTFSTFAFENLMYLKTGMYGLFAVYTIASILMTLLAVLAGLWLVKFA